MLGSIAASLALWLGLFAPGPDAPPPQQSHAFSFVVIGDAGEPGPYLTSTAKWMMNETNRLDAAGAPVGLLLFLGDNFYPNGLNHDRQSARDALVRSVLGPHRNLMAHLGRDRVQAVAGNHDYYCGTTFKIPYGTCDRGNQYEAALPGWTYHYRYPALLRYAVADGARDSADIILFDSALLLTQEPATWRPLLDSLERLLRRSAASPGVIWRFIAAHHSPYSVGEHGGYRLWSSDRKRVSYLGNCFEEKQDPAKYVEELISEQDNCTHRYRAYSDSLFAVIGRSGAHVQMMMAGHDHSLQLLNYPERNGPSAPKVFMISGAGSKQGRVKTGAAPGEYTHPLNTEAERGRSAPGFTVCTFEGNTLSIRFIDGRSGEQLSMSGATRFTLDRSGVLTAGR
ncbi:MAG: metallophosphoesterase [Bacteroidetes bacterium]|nr:metallophosphoesterase [Bacteroidota bacterium]